MSEYRNRHGLTANQVHQLNDMARRKAQARGEGYTFDPDIAPVFSPLKLVLVLALIAGAIWLLGVIG